MNPALPDLYALQEVDSALAAAYKQYRALDQGQAEKAAADAARVAFDEIAHTHHTTAGSLKDAELELQSLEARKKDHESKLYGGKITVFKELTAMQDEIASLGRHRALLDDKILELMEEVEAHRAQEAEAKTKLEAAEAAFAEKQTRFKAAGRHLAKEIKTLTAKREESLKPIPPAILKRYEAIRTAKQGVGIGKVVRGTCGGCGTNINSGAVSRAQDTQGIEVCDNCGRILYVPE